MKKLMSLVLALTMLLALMPLSAASAETQGVTLFGFSDLKLNSGSSAAATPRAFIGFNSETPSTIQVTSGLNGKESYAAEAVDGMIYAYAHSYSDSEVPAETFYRVNPATWTSAQVGTINSIYRVMDMTYASDRNTMYAMVYSIDDANYHLMTVNLTNGELTDVVTFAELGVSITTAFAYIGNGRFFGVTQQEGEGLIFSENGIVQRLGMTINENYEGVISITYYQPYDCLYAVKLQTLPGGNHGILIRINPATGSSEEVGTIGYDYGYSLTSIFALPDYAINAPGVEPQAELDAAINAAGSSLTFINDVTNPWTVNTQGSRVYVQSGNSDIDDSASTITAVFNGLTAGQVLTFDWMVSSESNYDWLRFSANGNLINRISGSVSWTSNSYTIPSNGNYTFTWSYTKDTSVSSGSDMGCIDNVALSGNQPEPYDPSIAADLFNDALNVAGGTIDFKNDMTNPWNITSDSTGRTYIESTINQYCAVQTVYFFLDNAKAGDAIRFDYKTDCETGYRLLFIHDNSIMKSFTGIKDWQQYTYIIPEDGNFVFSWQYAIPTNEKRALNKVWVDNIEYIADYYVEPPVNPDLPDESEFNAAVNAPGESRSFVNDNVNPWQIAVDGSRVCAVSNIAGMEDTQSSFTVDIGYVEAGTTITFDWKTSTEAGWDRACLTLNGYTYMSATGITNWTSATYTIENDGQYVIGWQYEKNDMGDGGQDCIWVDNVRIVPVQTGNYYTVTFVDGLDNSVISVQSVPEGGSATPPAAPVHEGYEFVGWSGDYNDVTADCTVTAIYEAVGLPGDVNGDNSVTSADALLVLRHSLELGQLPPEYVPYADVNADGLITSADALLILRISLNLA